MPKLLIAGFRIVGLAGAVPATSRSLADDAELLGTEEAKKVGISTGIDRRFVAPPEICTSDLATEAAQRLIGELGWAPESIDALILVTQTPDYLLPATSCVIQARLGLSTDCAAFDVNLGCSGYVYGLWLAATLIAGGIKRALLLVGDTSSRVVSPRDRSTVPLFGDGATATALESAPDAPPAYFELGSDGRGSQHIIIPGGGFRTPHTARSAEITEREGGNWRSDNDLFMDGAEVFSFTLRRVPALVKSLLGTSGQTVESTDAFVLHQANGFMLSHLAKRLGIPASKLPLSLDLFGNTSSASIPLTIQSRLKDKLSNGSLSMVLAGFGVGLSWAGAALTIGPIVIPDLITVDVLAIPDATRRQAS